MALGRGNVQINVGATGLTKSIVNQVQAAQSQIPNLNVKLNDKGFRQPLGRITGDLSEFQNSLDASVARTLAFGAAVGVINSLANAFKAMISSSLEVEKKLADVNVILNLNTKALGNFSSQLFAVAKNTGQSFDEVSDAAVELARQGLGAEETIKRINDAMILTRLSGMAATKSVETLTAAINGFGSAALTTTDIINKLATVDAAFAVSTDDLSNALARAGSTAQAAKVSMDELLGAVTSVQQTTARGGAVIGNAFKSIFTRIQRSSVREQLEAIGVATTDAAGNIRNAMSILKDYSGVYKTLSDGQRAYTDELLAGVFQINNLRALIKDLGSGFSIYERAVEQAGGATDEATRRNKLLNKTMSALVVEGVANLKELAATLGTVLTGPAVKNILDIFNSISSALTKALDPEKGSKLVQGMFSTIGSWISGPGLILIGAAFIKLFKFITFQSIKAVGEVFKIGKAADKVKQTEAQLTSILQNNASLYSAISNTTLTHAQREKLVLDAINAENAALRQQEAMITRLAQSRGIGGALRGKAGGFIPSFAKDVQGAIASEREAILAGEGGASSGAQAKVLRGFPTGGGRRETFVANTDEVIVPKFGGGTGSAIFNKDMMQGMGGVPAGAVPVARGFIPNFQKGKKQTKGSGKKGIIAQEKNIYDALYDAQITGIGASFDASAYGVLFGVGRGSGPSRQRQGGLNWVLGNSKGARRVIEPMLGKQITADPKTVLADYLQLGANQIYPHDHPRGVEKGGAKNTQVALDNFNTAAVTPGSPANDFATAEEEFSQKIIRPAAESSIKKIADTVFGSIMSDPGLGKKMSQSTVSGKIAAGAEGELFEGAMDWGSQVIGSEGPGKFAVSGDSATWDWAEAAAQRIGGVWKALSGSKDIDAKRKDKDKHTWFQSHSALASKVFQDPVAAGMLGNELVAAAKTKSSIFLADLQASGAKGTGGGGKASGFIPNLVKRLGGKGTGAMAKLSPLQKRWVQAVRGGEEIGGTMGLGEGGTESRASMPQLSKEAQVRFESDLKQGKGIAGKMLGGKKTQLSKGASKVAQLKATQKDIYGANVRSKLEGAFGKSKWDKPGPSPMPGWLSAPIIVSQDNRILDGHHRWATVYARDAIDDGIIGGLSMGINKIGLPIQPLLKLADDYSGQKQAGGATGGALGFIPNFADALEEAIVREKEALGVQGSGAGVYVGQDKRLKGGQNPMGLLVANSRDEPLAGSQGVNRAINGGMNPKTMGAAHGFVPNFQMLGFGEEVEKGGLVIGGPAAAPEPKGWKKLTSAVSESGMAAFGASMAMTALFGAIESASGMSMSATKNVAGILPMVSGVISKFGIWGKVAAVAVTGLALGWDLMTNASKKTSKALGEEIKKRDEELQIVSQNTEKADKFITTLDKFGESLDLRNAETSGKFLTDLFGQMQELEGLDADALQGLIKGFGEGEEEFKKTAAALRQATEGGKMLAEVERDIAATIKGLMDETEKMEDVDFRGFSKKLVGSLSDADFGRLGADVSRFERNAGQGQEMPINILLDSFEDLDSQTKENIRSNEKFAEQFRQNVLAQVKYEKAVESLKKELEKINQPLKSLGPNINKLGNAFKTLAQDADEAFKILSAVEKINAETRLGELDAFRTVDPRAQAEGVAAANIANIIEKAAAEQKKILQDFSGELIIQTGKIEEGVVTTLDQGTSVVGLAPEETFRGIGKELVEASESGQISTTQAIEALSALSKDGNTEATEAVEKLKEISKKTTTGIETEKAQLAAQRKAIVNQTSTNTRTQLISKQQLEGIGKFVAGQKQLTISAKTTKRLEQTSLLKDIVKTFETFAGADRSGALAGLREEAAAETQLITLTETIRQLTQGKLEIDPTNLQEVSDQLTAFTRGGDFQELSDSQRRLVSALESSTDELATTQERIGAGVAGKATVEVAGTYHISDASIAKMATQISAPISQKIGAVLGVDEDLLAELTGEDTDVAKLASSINAQSKANKEELFKSAKARKEITEQMSVILGDYLKDTQAAAGQQESAAAKLSSAAVALQAAADKLAANAAGGFIPNFAPSPVGRALSTEGRLGGKSPVVDYHPSVGTYVRDKATQKSFSGVRRDHPEGIQQAVKNSAKIQGATARGLVPNFAINQTGMPPGTAMSAANRKEHPKTYTNRAKEWQNFMREGKYAPAKGTADSGRAESFSWDRAWSTPWWFTQKKSETIWGAPPFRDATGYAVDRSYYNIGGTGPNNTLGNEIVRNSWRVGSGYSLKDEIKKYWGPGASEGGNSPEGLGPFSSADTLKKQRFFEIFAAARGIDAYQGFVQTYNSTVSSTSPKDTGGAIGRYTHLGNADLMNKGGQRFIRELYDAAGGDPSEITMADNSLWPPARGGMSPDTWLRKSSKNNEIGLNLVGGPNGAQFDDIRLNIDQGNDWGINYRVLATVRAADQEKWNIDLETLHEHLSARGSGSAFIKSKNMGGWTSEDKSLLARASLHSDMRGWLQDAHDIKGVLNARGSIIRGEKNMYMGSGEMPFLEPAPSGAVALYSGPGEIGWGDIPRIEDEVETTIEKFDEKFKNAKHARDMNREGQPAQGHLETAVTRAMKDHSTSLGLRKRVEGAKREHALWGKLRSETFSIPHGTQQLALDSSDIPYPHEEDIADRYRAFGGEMTDSIGERHQKISRYMDAYGKGHKAPFVGMDAGELMQDLLGPKERMMSSFSFEELLTGLERDDDFRLEGRAPGGTLDEGGLAVKADIKKTQEEVKKETEARELLLPDGGPHVPRRGPLGPDGVPMPTGDILRDARYQALDQEIPHWVSFAKKDQNVKDVETAKEKNKKRIDTIVAHLPAYDGVIERHKKYQLERLARVEREGAKWGVDPRTGAITGTETATLRRKADGFKETYSEAQGILDLLADHKAIDRDGRIAQLFYTSQAPEWRAQQLTYGKRPLQGLYTSRLGEAESRAKFKKLVDDQRIQFEGGGFEGEALQTDARVNLKRAGQSPKDYLEETGFFDQDRGEQNLQAIVSKARGMGTGFSASNNGGLFQNLFNSSDAMGRQGILGRLGFGIGLGGDPDKIIKGTFGDIVKGDKEGARIEARAEDQGPDQFSDVMNKQLKSTLQRVADSSDNTPFQFLIDEMFMGGEEPQKASFPLQTELIEGLMNLGLPISNLSHGLGGDDAWDRLERSFPISALRKGAVGANLMPTYNPKTLPKADVDALSKFIIGAQMAQLREVTVPALANADPGGWKGLADLVAGTTEEELKVNPLYLFSPTFAKDGGNPEAQIAHWRKGSAEWVPNREAWHARFKDLRGGTNEYKDTVGLDYEYGKIPYHSQRDLQPGGTPSSAIPKNLKGPGRVLNQTHPGMTTWLEAFQATFGPEVAHGRNKKLDALLGGPWQKHPFEKYGPFWNSEKRFAEAKEKATKLVEGQRELGMAEKPAGLLSDYAPFGYFVGTGRDSPLFRSSDSKKADDLWKQWKKIWAPQEGVPPADDANARGFIPNFAAVANEIAASRSAGYRKPVSGSQVKSMNIRGAGKTTYNTQESVFKAKGMTQPFIRPPADSRAAKGYAGAVGKKFGFNPYKDVAAQGFVPNLAPTDRIGGLEEAGQLFTQATENFARHNKEFGEAANMIKQSSQKLADASTATASLDLTAFSSAAETVQKGLSGLGEVLKKGVQLNSAPIIESLNALRTTLTQSISIQMQLVIPTIDVNVGGAGEITNEIQNFLTGALSGLITSRLQEREPEIIRLVGEKYGL